MDDRYRKPPGGSAPPEDSPPDANGFPPLEGYSKDGYPVSGSRVSPAGGGYPPAGGGSPPAGGGSPPAGGGSPPAGGGYPPAGGGYPPAGGGSPPAGGGYPPASGGYPPASGGYPPAGEGYPPAGGGYPPASGEHNPYAPPSAGYPPPQQAYGHQPYWQPYQLAGRGTRLGAAVLDGLLSLGAALPGLIVLFMSFESLESGKEDQLWLGLGLVIIGVLILAIYQWYLIATRGQSLAKKWLHIRIVKLDGSIPGFVNGVLLRGWVMSFITNIPYIGGIVGLVDPLLIFGQERRCLHDLIASTQVIVGDPEDEQQAYGY